MGESIPFDIGEKRIEAFYQGFFLGVIAHCERNYFIRSEFPAGEGCADMLFIAKLQTTKKKAIILEYKVGKNTNELGPLAKEALDQVFARDYNAEVDNHSHVTESLSLGLSFYGKDFCLEQKAWKK